MTSLSSLLFRSLLWYSSSSMGWVCTSLHLIVVDAHLLLHILLLLLLVLLIVSVFSCDDYCGGWGGGLGQLCCHCCWADDILLWLSIQLIGGIRCSVGQLRIYLRCVWIADEIVIIDRLRALFLQQTHLRGHFIDLIFNNFCLLVLYVTSCLFHNRR